MNYSNVNAASLKFFPDKFIIVIFYGALWQAFSVPLNVGN